jgi:hypothetical protein
MNRTVSLRQNAAVVLYQAVFSDCHAFALTAVSEVLSVALIM